MITSRAQSQLRTLVWRLHTRSMGSFPASVNITHIQELVYKAVSSLHWYYDNTAGSEENEIGTSLCVVGDCCGFHRYFSRGYRQSKGCRWWKERSRCPRQWWWGERIRRWWRAERSRWQPPLSCMPSLPSPQAPPPLSSFMPPLLGQYMHVHVRGSPFQCVLLSPQTGLWTHFVKLLNYWGHCYQLYLFAYMLAAMTSAFDFFFFRYKRSQPTWRCADV